MAVLNCAIVLQRIVSFSLTKGFPQWQLVSSECIGSQTDLGNDDFLPEVKCYLNVKTRSANYRFTVYLPVISALMINLLSFFLDVTSRLRFQLSTIAFGSLLLELLYLAVKLGSFSSLGQPKVVIYLGQMAVLVATTLLWSTIASHLVVSSNLEVPPKVIKVIEPLSPWLVSNDVEAMSLVRLENIGQSSSLATQQQQQKMQPNNVIFVQVVDKILFAFFLLLVIVLHN